MCRILLPSLYKSSDFCVIVRNAVLYSISFFGSLAVVESVNSAYKIACYTADTLKSCVVAVIASSALGAYVTDYTVYPQPGDLYLRGGLSSRSRYPIPSCI